MDFLAAIDESSHLPRALIGVVALLFIAFLLSSDRSRINPRIILGGLALQCVIAFGVLQVTWVEVIFGWIAQLFSVALQVSVDASGFVFGPLADIVKMNESFEGQGFVFAFMALPSILFFQPYLHFCTTSAFYRWL